MGLVNGLRGQYQRLAQGETLPNTSNAYSSSTYSSSPQVYVEKVKEVVVKSSNFLKALCAGILLIGVWMLAGSSLMHPPLPVPIKTTIPQARYLHLLVTSPKKSLNTCKLVISAGTNHYPTPNLVAWENVYDDTTLASSGAEIGKIRGVLDFFSLMGEERDQDVVVIPDPEGSIFQLRPDVLLERYMEIIRLGSERARLGLLPKQQNGTEQKIVFAAGKTCAREADDPACYVVPQSTLKRKVYGSHTDEILPQEEIPHLFVRERFLSTGFVMGELKAVKRLYEKALELLEADKARATEHDVLSRIFGEQEYYREVQRDQNRTPWEKRKHRIGRFFGTTAAWPLDPHPTHRKIDFVEADAAKFEFGIGLDYESLLGSEAINEKLMGFTVHNSTASMRKLRNTHGVTASGGTSLPTDLTRSFPPFYSRNPYWDKYPSRLTWNDVNLYTNLWSGTIPATIHSSPPSSSVRPENVENLSQKTWEQTWFHSFARQKMNDYVTTPDMRFTTLRGNGEEVAWWSIWREKWMLRNSKREWKEGVEKKEWVQWGDICDGYEKEVFGDDKGPWKSPVDDW